MRRLAIGLAALVTAACQDVTAPRDTTQPAGGLTTLLQPVTGSFSSNAVLSSDLVVEGSPITYTVDFGVRFSSISQVDYFFVFGDDPLEAGECLIFVRGGGFCNPGPAAQTSRQLSIPCSGDPVTCDGFRAGVYSEEIEATDFGSGAVTVRITSLTVMVTGTTEPSVVNVAIDIKPKSFPNTINPRSKAVVTVLIPSTATFDATTVDPLGIRFGPSGAAEVHQRGHAEDVDHDGDIDLILHFRPSDTGIRCGDTSASLTGKTLSGQVVEGTDSVLTVDCRRAP